MTTTTKRALKRINEWYAWAQQARSYLRLRPFDTDSTQNRSKERYRRIVMSSLAAMGSKGVAVLTSLVSVPLTLHYLGEERYGLWMTASSLIAALAFADLGMGNGLVNAIAKAHGRSDEQSARKAISSAVFLFAGIAGVLLAVFIACYPVIPWGGLYNLRTSIAVTEAGPATAVLVVSFLVSMPLGIVQRVQIGYQEGFRANAWAAGGSLLGLIGVLIAIHYKAGLPWLACAMVGGPIVASIFNWVDVFYRTRPMLRPHWASFNWGNSRALAGSGIHFFILQFCAVIGNASDNIIITHVVGVSAVAGYAVTQKLFSSAQVAQYFIAPLWPAFGEAMARKDFEWARRTLTRALWWSGIASVLTAIPLCLFGRQIIIAWMGVGVAPSAMLILGFGCWVLLAGYGGVMSTFLNRDSLLQAQTILYAVSSVTAFVLKIVFAQHWAATGVIWATVIGYSIFYVIPAAKLAYRDLRRADTDSPPSIP